MAKEGKVKVVSAIYELESGKVNWLKEGRVNDILKLVEASAKKMTQPFAGK